jgi:hypothetical protein
MIVLDRILDLTLRPVFGTEYRILFNLRFQNTCNELKYQEVCDILARGNIVKLKKYKQFFKRPASGREAEGN